MRNAIVCATLLALLTTVSLAQRGRGMGGIGPTPRIPNAGPAAPNATFGPNGISHGGVLPNVTQSPNATGVAKNPSARPNATFDPNGASHIPNVTKDPNVPTLPEARSPGIPER